MASPHTDSQNSWVYVGTDHQPWMMVFILALCQLVLELLVKSCYEVGIVPDLGGVIYLAVAPLRAMVTHLTRAASVPNAAPYSCM